MFVIVIMIRCLIRHNQKSATPNSYFLFSLISGLCGDYSTFKKDELFLFMVFKFFKGDENSSCWYSPKSISSASSFLALIASPPSFSLPSI